MKIGPEEVNLSVAFGLEAGKEYLIQNTDDTAVCYTEIRELDTPETENIFVLQPRGLPWVYEQRDELVLYARAPGGLATNLSLIER